MQKTGKLVLASDACERGSFLHSIASTVTQLAFDALDGPPVVVGSRNWITPGAEMEQTFFPQPEWIIDAIHERLLPLRHRIGIKYELAPFSAKDTAQYILFRLQNAGGLGQVFTPKALTRIHQITKGNPRMINIICDNALLTAFSEDLSTVDRPIIDECLEELRLSVKNKKEKVDNEKQSILKKWFG